MVKLHETNNWTALSKNVVAIGLEGNAAAPGIITSFHQCCSPGAHYTCK